MIFLPLVLPLHWTHKETPNGVTIEARTADGLFLGRVDVDEKGRGWAFGRAAGSESYTGLGWRERLYKDAVTALQRATIIQ